MNTIKKKKMTIVCLQYNCVQNYKKMSIKFKGITAILCTFDMLAIDTVTKTRFCCVCFIVIELLGI